MVKKTGLAVVPMTEDRVDQVCRLHLDAFRGYMNARIGTRYAKGFLRWFCRHERAIALVATGPNGAVLGYVVGAPWGYGKELNRVLFVSAALGILVRPWLLFEQALRARIMARLRILAGRPAAAGQEPSLPQPAMCLVGIGVASAARGQGAGEMLVKAFENAARSLQMRSAYLEVYAHNQGAQRLYERCGWRQLPTGGDPHELSYYRVLNPPP